MTGCPLRLSVSARTLANGQAELKPRGAAEATLVPLAEVVRRCGGCWTGGWRGWTGNPRNRG